MGKKLVLTGGFPCQDVSAADPKRVGITGLRSGLWKQMYEAIGFLQPDYAIVENVPGLRKWLGTILGDLAEVGYNAQWHSIPARAVGAPHRRDRLWIVAYPQSKSGLQAYTMYDSIGKKLQARIATGGIYWDEMAKENWSLPDRWITWSDDGVSRRLACIAYGNAIVPQVAQVIFEVIKELEERIAP